LEVRPTFLEPEYPFEWAGTYSLKEGFYTVELSKGPDPSMDVVVSPVTDTSEVALRAGLEAAALAFSEKRPVLVSDKEGFRPDGKKHRLSLNRKGRTTFRLDIEHDGAFALFTQHQPSEFALQLRRGPEAIETAFEHVFNPEHEHDASVASVSLAHEGALDPQKLNNWMGRILREKGVDIFRMKGILNIQGDDNRFVFQGVHMLFDGRPDRPWGDERRHNQLVFIGRNLDERELRKGFESCLAR
jgi:G3E family GTPase